MAQGVISTDKASIFDGGYRILARAGSTATHDILKAIPKDGSEPVAILWFRTELAANDPRLAAFHAAARAVCIVSHPAIAEAIEHGVFARRPYLVVEWTEGATLAERLDSGRLLPSEAMSIHGLLGSAVSTAHRAGLAHGFLSAERIVSREHGGVAIVGFGLGNLLAVLGVSASDPRASESDWNALGDIGARIAGLFVAKPREPSATARGSAPIQYADFSSAPLLDAPTGMMAMPTMERAPSSPLVAQAPSSPSVAQAPSSPSVAQAPSSPSVAQAPSSPFAAKASGSPAVAEARRPIARRASSAFADWFEDDGEVASVGVRPQSIVPAYVQWVSKYLPSLSPSTVISQRELRERSFHLAMACTVSLFIVMLLLAGTS